MPADDVARQARTPFRSMRTVFLAHRRRACPVSAAGRLCRDRLNTADIRDNGNDCTHSAERGTRAPKRLNTPSPPRRHQHPPQPACPAACRNVFPAHRDIEPFFQIGTFLVQCPVASPSIPLPHYPEYPDTFLLIFRHNPVVHSLNALSREASYIYLILHNTVSIELYPRPLLKAFAAAAVPARPCPAASPMRSSCAFTPLSTHHPVFRHPRAPQAIRHFGISNRFLTSAKQIRITAFPPHRSRDRSSR